MCLANSVKSSRFKLRWADQKSAECHFYMYVKIYL